MPHPVPSSDLPAMDRLRQIMHVLRSPGGCPWDAEQTHESLLKHLIEEAYEVAEAVKGGEDREIIDELGDLLLQPVFHAEIASQEGRFDFDDIAEAIADKLVRRHPHVFGDAVADDPDAVLHQWEAIKKGEKNDEGSQTTSERNEWFLTKTHEGLPALLSAQKLQKKAARVGFDWPDLPPVLEKIEEEFREVEEALQSGDRGEIGEEIGDLLFAVVNLARKSGHEAELLLAQANHKFVTRFQAVEASLERQGKTLEEATLEEMDLAWETEKKRV